MPQYCTYEDLLNMNFSQTKLIIQDTTGYANTLCTYFI